MAQANGTRHQTAFTVSIEARDGVTTGISAYDRAHTVAVAINPEMGRDHITTPGHVFPLMAREGGTLIRAGHTEAAVDIARLAGLNPAGVICEIMNDDGSMARLPDLVAFAQHHNLKLGTIEDLIGHRRRTEQLVRRVHEGVLGHAEGGDWRMLVYANTVEYAEHLVLIKGDLSGPQPPLVRVHAVDLLSDMLGGPQPNALHGAMRMIAAEGRGAGGADPRGGGDLAVRTGAADGRQPAPPAVPARLRRRAHRSWSISGVKDMVLLSNTHRTVVGLEAYGLNIVDQRADRRCVGMSTADAPLADCPHPSPARRPRCCWCGRPTTRGWWTA